MLCCHPHVLSSPCAVIPMCCHPRVLSSPCAVIPMCCNPHVLPSPFAVIPHVLVPHVGHSSGEELNFSPRTELRRKRLEIAPCDFVLINFAFIPQAIHSRSFTAGHSQQAVRGTMSVSSMICAQNKYHKGLDTNALAGSIDTGRVPHQGLPM